MYNATLIPEVNTVPISFSIDWFSDFVQMESYNMYSCVWLLLQIKTFWNSSVMLKVSVDRSIFIVASSCTWRISGMSQRDYWQLIFPAFSFFVSYPCALSESLWGRIVRFIIGSVAGTIGLPYHRANPRGLLKVP